MNRSPTALQTRQHPPDGRVPITIGITGHRKIHPDAVEHIAKQLRHLFGHLKERFSVTPLYLISPLAEGADQLAAKLALEQNIAIYAVLPMEKNDYIKDFDTPSIQESFHGLLTKAAYCKTLTSFDATEQRDLCYANVGKWIVDQSDFVISLWDGNFNELTGGTGEVVNYALSGEFPSLETQLPSEDWIARTRTVIHIHTPRQSESQPELKKDMLLYENTDALLKTQSTQRKDVEHAVSELTNLKRVNSFNKVLARKDVQPGYPLLDSDVENLPDHLAFIHQLYLKSDVVANHYQAIFRRYTFIFYALTSVMMATLLLYFRVFPFAVVLALYVLIYVVTIAVSVRIRNSDFQRKYHLYRAVGEISRLFFFFNLSEIGRSKRASILTSYRELQYMTRKLGDGNTWFIDALRKIRLFDMDKPVPDLLNEPMTLVTDHWIKDQRNYFEKALLRDERKLRILGWSGVLLFFISLASGIALFSIGYLKLPIFELVKPGFSALIGISAGLGGILKTYTFTMGLSELIGRYRLMLGLFEHAEERMQNDQAHKDAIFEQLWWEALMENIEWFSLKDSRLISTISIKSALQGFASLAKIKS